MCTCPPCATEKSAGVAAYEAWLDQPPVTLATITCDHLAAMRRRHDTAMASPSLPPIPEETPRAHAR